MTKQRILEQTTLFLLPIVFVGLLIPNTLTAWFGLADDHQFAKALSTGEGDVSHYFSYFYGLQPWGATSRFNPSQLLGWTLETILFEKRAFMWRATQLLAVLIAIYSVGRATQIIMNFSRPNQRFNLLISAFAQGLFLSLPFWSHTIGRIGAPETFAATILALLYLCYASAMKNPNKIKYPVMSATLTCLLIGFKENLITIGLLSLALQIVFMNRKTKGKIKKWFKVALLCQTLYFTFVIFGFLPTLVNQGEDIYGTGIGLERFRIGKWLIVPIFSLAILLVSAYVVKLKRSILRVQCICLFLVLCDYFVMRGMLSGHYGFLSGTLVAIQLALLILCREMLNRKFASILAVALIAGILLNFNNTQRILSDSKIFKNQIDLIESKLLGFDIANIVITVRSVDEYEALVSLSSFLQNTDSKIFLRVDGELSEGGLADTLYQSELNGNLSWGVNAYDSLQIGNDCVEVFFAETSSKSICETSQYMSWLGEK